MNLILFNRMTFMGNFTQDDFKRVSLKGLKLLGRSNMVLHCHHYNARIQTSLEQNSKIDGKHIFRKSTALVYNEMLNALPAFNLKNAIPELDE